MLLLHRLSVLLLHLSVSVAYRRCAVERFGVHVPLKRRLATVRKRWGEREKGRVIVMIMMVVMMMMMMMMI